MNRVWHNWARKKGYRVSFGSRHLVETSRNILEELRRKDLIDETFYKEWLNDFKYLVEIDSDRFETLVMVAIPKSAYKMEFKYNGQSGIAIIPPTYVQYRPAFHKILAEARSFFGKNGHYFKLIDAPLKTLAVLTGLAKYGRNNVVYIPEMGSYFQLVGLVTDMTIKTKNPGEDLNIHDNLMPRCEDCSACLNACPTGAIHHDRILLHAQKCFTSLSEKSGELPETPLPPSPECIIGCLKCQNICTMNKGKLTYKNTPFSLTEEETSFIVNNFNSEAPKGKRIKQKFDLLHLSKGVDIFSRNFQHLVKLSLIKSP